MIPLITKVRNIDFYNRKMSDKHKFKCDYSDSGEFKTLRVVCTYFNEIFIYEISGKLHEITSRNSISFYVKENGDSISINWQKDIQDHMTLKAHLWID